MLAAIPECVAAAGDRSRRRGLDDGLLSDQTAERLSRSDGDRRRPAHGTSTSLTRDATSTSSCCFRPWSARWGRRGRRRTARRTRSWTGWQQRTACPRGCRRRASGGGRGPSPGWRRAWIPCSSSAGTGRLAAMSAVGARLVRRRPSAPDHAHVVLCSMNLARVGHALLWRGAGCGARSCARLRLEPRARLGRSAAGAARGRGAADTCPRDRARGVSPSARARGVPKRSASTGR